MNMPANPMNMASSRLSSRRHALKSAACGSGCLAPGYVSFPAGDQVLEGRQLDAWAQFFQALFASMDFRYVN